MQNTQFDKLIMTLKERFENNMNRHKGIVWKEVEEILKSNEDKLKVILNMEETGGEPDVVRYDNKRKEYIFMDCSKESPFQRRSLCYDEEALDSRKINKPKGSVMQMVEKIGFELLNEEEYRYLQSIQEFDLKTSSWIKTPKEIRDLGGALFADRRYNQVFVYHNGVESYYSSRGFRGMIGVSI